MRFAGPFALTLATAVLCMNGTRADDLAMSSNPYSSIPERNVFALVPIPPPPTNDPSAVPIDPPPKITVNGTMTIFGKPQVLYKITPKALPGQPPKEESFVSAEGERNEDIVVTKIDMVGRMVSFINHGLAQDIPVANDAKLTTPVPAVPAAPGMNPAVAGGVPLPAPASTPVAAQNVGRGTRGRSLANGYSQPDQNATGNVGAAGAAGTAGTGGGAKPQNIEDQVMNAAQQIAQIEMNRLENQKIKDAGGDPGPELPPTPLTPPDVLQRITSPTANAQTEQGGK